MNNSAPVTPVVGPPVHIDHVSASFGDLKVLDDISIDIEPGEVVSVIGRSGAGKSTLIRIIADLLPATAGSVSIGDRTAYQARRDKLFGFMPQKPSLLPWRSAIHNVALVTEGARKPNSAALGPMQALEAVGLGGQAEYMPSELSGGMAHRVALARTISTGAPVMLLDEPMSSVDERTRHQLYTELIDIIDAQRPTTVFVTHDLTEAALLSDRVLVLGGAPADICAEIAIDCPRPRTKALDSGELREPITALRAALQEMDA